MKLLDWMKRKLVQNSIEPLKNVSIGNSGSSFLEQSFDEHEYHSQQSYILRTKRVSPKYLVEVTENKPKKVLNEEPSIRMSELSHSFLTIGTFGTEQIIMEPAMPTFDISFQKQNEKETEKLDKKLKLIINKLEKFLEFEEKKDFESSGMCYVNSTTLNKDQTESGYDEEQQNMATCTLPQYVYCSSLESPETGEEITKGGGPVEKLFMKNSNKKQQTQQNKKKGANCKETYSMNFINKMLKKFHIPSKRCTTSASGPAAESVSTKKKLPKRIIDPESSTADKKLTRSYKYENNSTLQSDENQDKDMQLLDSNIKKFLPTTMLKEEIKARSLCHNRLSRRHSTGKGEHWINTDADYVVLEL